MLKIVFLLFVISLTFSTGCTTCKSIDFILQHPDEIKSIVVEKLGPDIEGVEECHIRQPDVISSLLGIISKLKVTGRRPIPEEMYMYGEQACGFIDHSMKITIVQICPRGGYGLQVWLTMYQNGKCDALCVQWSQRRIVDYAIDTAVYNSIESLIQANGTK